MDWRFVPSTQLGGDSFGYHWIDGDHFAVYLLDVSGHGVGASLLSVSALNVLRSQSLRQHRFPRSGAGARTLQRHVQDGATGQPVLHDLVWSVLEKRRRLTYASGGHPPALLLAGPDPSAVELRCLESPGPPIGWDVDLPFENAVLDLDACARILVFSDGVYEIEKTDGENWDFDQFLRFMAATGPDGNAMERLLAHTRQLHGSDILADDFSMLELIF